MIVAFVWDCEDDQVMSSANTVDNITVGKYYVCFEKNKK